MLNNNKKISFIIIFSAILFILALISTLIIWNAYAKKKSLLMAGEKDNSVLEETPIYKDGEDLLPLLNGDYNFNATKDSTADKDLSADNKPEQKNNLTLINKPSTVIVSSPTKDSIVEKPESIRKFERKALIAFEGFSSEYGKDVSKAKDRFLPNQYISKNYDREGSFLTTPFMGELFKDIHAKTPYIVLLGENESDARNVNNYPKDRATGGLAFKVHNANQIARDNKITQAPWSLSPLITMTPTIKNITPYFKGNKESSLLNFANKKNPLLFQDGARQANIGPQELNPFIAGIKKEAVFSQRFIETVAEIYLRIATNNVEGRKSDALIADALIAQLKLCSSNVVELCRLNFACDNGAKLVCGAQYKKRSGINGWFAVGNGVALNTSKGYPISTGFLMESLEDIIDDNMGECYTLDDVTAQVTQIVHERLKSGHDRDKHENIKIEFDAIFANFDMFLHTGCEPYINAALERYDVTKRVMVNNKSDKVHLTEVDSGSISRT